ncbi:MAG: GntR family transcriptional regulator [Acidobacteriota bacterium]
MIIIKIEPASFIPIYEQIKKEIKSRISLGSLRPNEPLPSIRDLAAELVVNPNTVARAYRDLEHEGFIYTRKGKASFVTENSTSLIQRERLRRLDEIMEWAVEEAQKFGFSHEEIGKAFEEKLRIESKQARG